MSRTFSTRWFTPTGLTARRGADVLSDMPFSSLVRLLVFRDPPDTIPTLYSLAPSNLPIPSVSGPQDRPRRDIDFARLDLRTVAEPHPRHLDKSALGEDAHALRTSRDDLAEFFAAHRAESRRHDFLGVEKIKLLRLRLFILFVGRPGARGRI